MPHPKKLTADWLESWEKLLAENLPFKVFLKGPDLTYLACNENYAADHGLKPSEILGRSDYDLYPRELAETYRAEDLRILETGRSETIEVRYLKDGQEHHGQTIKSLFRNQSGQVIGILGTFWDITELVQVKEALRQSEEKYRSLVETAIEGVASVDLEGNLTFVNDALCRMLGYSQDKLLHKPFAGILHPDDAPALMETFLSVVAGTSAIVTIEFRAIQKNGQSLWLSTQPTAIVIDGNVIGFNAILSDITERKRAEEVLRESERKLKIIFDLLPMGVSVLDNERKIVYENPALRKIIQMDREDLQREKYKTRMYIRPDGTPMSADEFASIRAAREGKAIYNVETGIVLEDGKLIWTDVSAVPVALPDWKMVVLTVDITARKQAEEALRESEHRLADIIDFLPDATFAINLKGEVIAWNRALEELTGAPKEELIGKGDFAYAVPFYGKTVPMLIDLIFQNLEELKKNYDYLVKREDQVVAEAFVPALRGGKGAYLWGTASPLYDSSGSIVGAIESLHDITDRKQVEEALRESEEKFRTLVEMSPDGIFLEDLHGRILECNQAGAEIYGYTREELLGLNIREIVPEEFARTLTDPISEDTGGLYEKRLSQRKDGSIFPSEISTRFSTIGGQNYLLVQVRDITERKRAEEVLRESEAWNKTILHTVLSGAIVIEAATRKIVEVNDTALGLIGLAKEQVIGFVCHQFICPAEEKNCPILDLGQKVDFSERFLLTADGNRKNIIKTVVPVQMSGRSYLIESFVDITERKRIEKELLESEEKARRLIENSHDIIYTLTPDGVLTFVSPSWTALLGHPVDQVLGSPFQAFVHPDDLTRCQALLQRMAETGQRQTGVEYRVQHADGSWRWHVSNAVPLKDEAGTVIGYEGIASDITDRKQSEGEMEKTRADFLFGVSHELKTPLFLMDISLEMLENSSESGRVKRTAEFMETWKRNLHRLRHLVFNMVDSQRTQTIGFKLERQQTDFRRLVEQVVQENKLLAQPKKVRITQDLAPIPPLWIDPEAIHRLVENLLTNAIKFSPRNGEVTVRSKVEDAQAVLTVKDQGHGISAEEQKGLFLPFQRAASAVHNVIPGTGLGLYVAKMIVEAHGGSVELESQLGQGTTVTVRLPLERPKDEKP